MTLGSEPARYGETPVDPDERHAFAEGFTAETKAEIDQAEADAIELILLEGTAAIAAGDTDLDGLTSRHVLEDLHERALKSIWSWAGQIRLRDMSIGTDPSMIRTQLPEALDTIRFWIDAGRMSAYEVAIRAHHSLVKIHPFVDVNGRITRVYADLLMFFLTQDSVIDWSNADRDKRAYVDALRKADQAAGDVTDLMQLLAPSKIIDDLED